MTERHFELAHGCILIGVMLLAGCTNAPATSTAPTMISSERAGSVVILSDTALANVVQIIAVTHDNPYLFISGAGFGSSGATVTINGVDVSDRIREQTETSITLKGGRKKLNLRSGPNQIQVIAGGVPSNIFVLNL